MTVEFLPQARTEWVEAISYYNEQRSDLGHEFALEVDRTLERILQFPRAWALIAERTRRAPSTDFLTGFSTTFTATRLSLQR